MTTVTIETIAAALTDIEAAWGVRPRLVLACAGGSDQHWQIYHPDHPDMPTAVILMDGTIEDHPDSPI